MDTGWAIRSPEGEVPRPTRDSGMCSLIDRVSCEHPVQRQPKKLEVAQVFLNRRVQVSFVFSENDPFESRGPGHSHSPSQPTTSKPHPKSEDNVVPPRKREFQTRSYQQELLDESMHRNIVIALDTGSGKTHIAVLRIKLEMERNTHKLCWFLAPTVALVEQQHSVISTATPVSVGMVSGSSEPDQWKDATLWRKLLDTHRIMVTTPQILLDALSHGFVSLGEVSLLVFDEAHHAASGHPYNAIMSAFYFPLPLREGSNDQSLGVRPMILGLTASPIYGGNIEKSFRTIESNLDCVIRSSRYNREELAQYVHRPVFKRVLYPLPEAYAYDEISWSGPSRNIIALNEVIRSLNIDEDPYVISLRQQLQKLPQGIQRARIDQRLSKTIDKKDTFTHKGLRDFARTAADICWELGPWAADWYVAAVVEQGKTAATVYNMIMSTWKEDEKRYLLSALNRIQLSPASTDPKVIRANLSPKVAKLVECLLEEEGLTRSDNETYSGIVFVTRRDTVVTLGHLLSVLPETAAVFHIGCLLGSSTSSKRHSFLDITRIMVKDPYADVLRDFADGDKNLIISTAVAEEGIDIQACGSVIRFDPPPNMVAWAQSRGRARRKKSTFILMLDELFGARTKMEKWENMEQEMMKMYTDPSRLPPAEDEEEEMDDYVEFRVESTGALLTLDSAISHLYHFCSILPSTGHGYHLPIFELDPPDYPPGWHAFEGRERLPPIHEGPWKATCTLPRVLDPKLRSYTTPKAYLSKRSARAHAAFFAYKSLYDAGQLTDNLLPLWSALQGNDQEEVDLLLKEVAQRAGTANVPIQMDPYLVTSPVVEKWWSHTLIMGDLPPLRMLTPFQLPSFAETELPWLYVPGKKPLQVRLASSEAQEVTQDLLDSAKEYTRRIFFCIYGTRMDYNKEDFTFLFLPLHPTKDHRTWEGRREWMADRIARSEEKKGETVTQANARHLGEFTKYSTDLAIVRDNTKFSKLLRFVGWHKGPISAEEEEDLRARYERLVDIDIQYPLLVVQALPRRVNFLVPLENEDAGLSKEDMFLALPEHATVDLISREEAEIAMVIPSFLRWLSKASTAHALRSTLYADSPLASIPLDLLITAITAPVSQEDNYQRLETLGDTVLKYIISIQLFAEHPYWHEGYLARRKDHAVNNHQLAKEAIRKGVYQYIIRDRFVPRKWVPRYLSDKPALDLAPPEEDERENDKEHDSPTPDPETLVTAPSTSTTGPAAVPTPVANEPTSASSPAQTNGTPAARSQSPPQTVNGDGSKPKKKKKKQKQQLSTKVLADVVEALIGAACEHGGFDLAVRCIEIFGLGVPKWESVSRRVEESLSRVEHRDNLPSQLSYVERMLGYEFKRKMLLVEALTHSSYQGDLDNISYERLEFIGDSALDMVVTDYLYHAPGKNYSPGHMHLKKEALVNSHMLAYLCLNTSLTVDASMPTWNPEGGATLSSDKQVIYLYQCLLHSSSVILDDQKVTFGRFQKNKKAIERGLTSEMVYPWAALTSLQAPKFISDQIESLLGAVFLDCGGDLNVIRDVLKKIGHFTIMERIVREEVDVLHPISRLAIWAAKYDPPKELDIKVLKVKGTVSCSIFVDEVEISNATERYRGRTSRNGVRFAAAGEAIAKLGIIEQEKPQDVDEVGWPEDVPQFEW
ncbi:P-loop containing nucleoside triphosphate hydrolase protein [Panus rudis PR-1116 ss-1]|nr:P-loop containing nucleoside triphosphate hydrolase protein [Panus rudis PR-1116 ss-1]